MKEQKARSKIAESEKEISKTKEEIKAKEADTKEQHHNELAKKGKIKTFTARKKPEHTKEFEEAKGYVDHVIKEGDKHRVKV